MSLENMQCCKLSRNVGCTSVQPKKYLESKFQAKFKGLDGGLRCTRKLALLGYEELGGLSDSRPWDI